MDVKKKYYYQYDKICSVCSSPFIAKSKSVSVCSKQCKTVVISQKKMKYAPTLINQITKLRHSGMTVQAIATQLSQPLPAVEYILERHRIVLSDNQYDHNVHQLRKDKPALNADGTKRCSTCQIDKVSGDFYLSSTSKSGLSSSCKDCQKALYLLNRDAKLDQRKRYKLRNRDNVLEQHRKYYQSHKQEEHDKRKVRFARSPEKYKEMNRLSNQRNQRSKNAWSAEYRASKLDATPSWLSDDQKEQIKQIYRLCPKGYHVDHIVPLQGEMASGLHTPWNLQYLMGEDDCSKQNSPTYMFDQSDIGTCHQHLRKEETRQEDITNGCPTDISIDSITLNAERASPEHAAFIERYEWLGKVGFGVRWVFTARYQDRLCGVIMMSEPTGYSSFGMQYEVLIQRGATASWAPKNLGSRLLMYACRWMVKHSTKRLFIGYSDSTAGEIGTIYQACNFDYLGHNFGAKVMYQLPNGNEVSGRYFTRTSSMKKWAKILNIIWQPEWTKLNGFQDVSAIPPLIKKEIRNYAKLQRLACPFRFVPPKGKYVLLLWKNNYEKRMLLARKQWTTLPYPKRIQ